MQGREKNKRSSFSLKSFDRQRQQNQKGRKYVKSPRLYQYFCVSKLWQFSLNYFTSFTEICAQCCSNNFSAHSCHFEGFQNVVLLLLYHNIPSSRSLAFMHLQWAPAQPEYCSYAGTEGRDERQRQNRNTFLHADNDYFQLLLKEYFLVILPLVREDEVQYSFRGC